MSHPKAHHERGRPLDFRADKG